MIGIAIPSKGRPERCAQMIASARTTAAERIRFLVVIPHEQPVEPYQAVVAEGAELLAAPSGFVRCLNRGAMTLVDDVSIVGAFGDDVLFRTPGWDLEVTKALATPGMAYGDDLVGSTLHGKPHPTAVWVSSEIVRALGWLGLPTIGHQWADDVWRDLFEAAGCARYLSGVIVEHIHPAVRKAEMDATYEAVFGANDGAAGRAAADFAAYEAWKVRAKATDVETVEREVRRPIRAAVMGGER